MVHKQHHLETWSQVETVWLHHVAGYQDWGRLLAAGSDLGGPEAEHVAGPRLLLLGWCLIEPETFIIFTMTMFSDIYWHWCFLKGWVFCQNLGLMLGVMNFDLIWGSWLSKSTKLIIEIINRLMPKYSTCLPALGAAGLSCIWATWGRIVVLVLVASRGAIGLSAVWEVILDWGTICIRDKLPRPWTILGTLPPCMAISLFGDDVVVKYIGCREEFFELVIFTSILT